MSLSSHQSSRMKSDTWLTPPSILEELGEFDLDPCCPLVMPWTTAKTMYSYAGLEKPWFGRVWCNPPFGREAIKWLDKMDEHGCGTALVPARTETKAWFRYVWPRASGVLFIRGRPHFHYADGSRAPFNSGAPIALVAYGIEDAEILSASRLGEFLPLNVTARKEVAMGKVKSPHDSYELVERESELFRL